MKEIIPTKNNIYAKNVEGKEIHISEATSGRNGYFCLGCEAEMEARKSEKISSYFAHVPKDVNIERKCIYSDETYRHKLAKEILQNIKKVKIPPLYKYPPSNLSDKKPVKIQDAKLVIADSVLIERQFYENEDGEIQYGQNIDFEKNQNKYLLIQPDVAFFDKENKPILLIELVATHSINEEKLVKIKRLGIDTIQIRIPKDSPEKIKNTFYKTNRTEWIFNYEQEITNYLSISNRNSEEIPPIDKFQRKLLKAEESFSCRQAEINNLVRAIRKCLESEQFKKSEQKITTEIIRTERNTERNREQLSHLQKEISDDIKRAFRSKERETQKEEEEIKISERKFRKTEKEFQQYCSNLESRYNRKAEELKSTIQDYRPECQGRIDELKEKAQKLGGDTTNPNSKLNRIRERRTEVKEFTERIQRSFVEISYEEASIDYKRGRIEQEFKQKFKERRKKIEKQYSEFEKNIRREFENRRNEAIKAVMERDINGKQRIHGRIERITSAQQTLIHISEAKSYYRKLKAAKKLFESKAWRNWD